MLRFALLLMVSLTLACSDLGSVNCPEGQTRLDGVCAPDPSAGGTGGAPSVDLPPTTKTITVGCTNNITSQVATLGWELTVDPGPIVGGEPFAADLRGVAVFDEVFLDAALAVVPFTRVNLLQLQGTVHVREGVTSEVRDAVLTSEPIPTTCTYDENGNAGIEAGTFRACSPEANNPDGSNDGCTGLDGMPLPENPCGQFVTIPTSIDCAPGGECDDLGKLASQCEVNSFCVVGPVEVILQGSLEGYRAAESGNVLFGWDDQSTGAVVDQTGGPNDGRWILPNAVFDDPVGPNGIRVVVAVLSVAIECTMGVGVDVLSPAPDPALISFPIQQR